MVVELKVHHETDTKGGIEYVTIYGDGDRRVYGYSMKRNYHKPVRFEDHYEEFLPAPLESFEDFVEGLIVGLKLSGIKVKYERTYC